MALPLPLSYDRRDRSCDSGRYSSRGTGTYSSSNRKVVVVLVVAVFEGEVVVVVLLVVVEGRNSSGIKREHRSVSHLRVLFHLNVHRLH